MQLIPLVDLKGPPGLSATGAAEDAAALAAFLEAAGAPNDFSTYMDQNVLTRVRPSGDTTGEADSDAIESLITFLSARGGGTVHLYGPEYYINRRIVIPQSVNIWGEGMGQELAPTRIYCTTVDSGISFGDRLTGGRGGVSGNFSVDGTNVATNPVYFGLTVQRTFIGLESINGLGVGFLLEGTQNCTFIRCATAYNKENVVFDYAAAGNNFYTIESDQALDWHVVFQQSGASAPGLNTLPFGNHFWGGLLERGASEGIIWNKNGEINSFHDVQMVHGENIEEFSIIRMDSGFLTVDNCTAQTIYGNQATVYDVRGGKLVINGTPVIIAVKYIFDISGSGEVRMNGELHHVGTGVKLAPSSKKPVELQKYEYAALGTDVIYSNGTYALTTGLLQVPNAWWELNPSEYPTAPEGRELQYRVVVRATGLESGDIFSAVLLDSLNLVGMSSEFSKPATSDDVVTVRSDWLSFPSAPVYGYLMARNITGERGTVTSAFIQIRIV